MGIIPSAKDYMPRLIDRQLDRYIQSFGAVCIEGPKWCGKSWTAAFHAQSEILISDPDNNFQNRTLAELSPSLVLEGAAPRLIDEWQEVPALWDAVRATVDRRGLKGQFILTGSATPPQKGVLHSGAGRIGRLRMRPMSLYESGDSRGLVSLEDICENRAPSLMTGETELKQLIYLTMRGGWPGNLRAAPEDALLLPTSYIDAILNDDIQRMDGRKRSNAKLRLLLRSLARNESTTATMRLLKNDIREIDGEDVDPETVTTYLDVFDRLFLLDNQPPFSNKLRSSVRVKQAEKRHLSDPSLACALLGATGDKLLNDLETFGFLFEALCERDLKIYADSMDAKLYHYQDYANHEIDAVIEQPNGDWCAVEIKLGANKIEEAADNLIKIKNKLQEVGERAPKALCVVCGLSNVAYRRPDGVYVVPITALRP